MQFNAIEVGVRSSLLKNNLYIYPAASVSPVTIAGRLDSGVASW